MMLQNVVDHVDFGRGPRTFCSIVYTEYEEET